MAKDQSAGDEHGWQNKECPGARAEREGQQAKSDGEVAGVMASGGMEQDSEAEQAQRQAQVLGQSSAGTAFDPVKDKDEQQAEGCGQRPFSGGQCLGKDPAGGPVDQRKDEEGGRQVATGQGEQAGERSGVERAAGSPVEWCPFDEQLGLGVVSGGVRPGKQAAGGGGMVADILPEGEEWEAEEGEDKAQPGGASDRSGLAEAPVEE